MKKFVLNLILLFLVLACMTLHASDIPRKISHQGILTHIDGTPVEDGTYSFTFRIYHEEDTGSAIWEEIQNAGVEKGIFHAYLGSVVPLNLDFDREYWIGISVDGGGEFIPRIPLGSAPYAFMAYSVRDGAITTSKLAGASVTQDKLHPDVSLPLSGIAGGDLTGLYPNPVIAENAITTPKLADESVTQEKLHPDIHLPLTGIAGGDLTGNYPNPKIALPYSGVTSTPLSVFMITNTGEGIAIEGLATSDAGESYGVAGKSASPDGVGVAGYATAETGESFGVAGKSASPDGAGVIGLATAKSGESYGVWGLSASTGGSGVYGYATADSGFVHGVIGRTDSPFGTGVYGNVSSGSGMTHGVEGESSSTSGIGVFGFAPATTGETRGIAGESDSNQGIGVLGITNSQTGVTYGVAGESSSSDGRGVFGLATARSGETYGVMGESASPKGVGVNGFASATSGANFGVVGRSASNSGIGISGVASSNSGTTIGVQGMSFSADGYGVFSFGRFAATGTKDFQIDHPLDPSNKYLNHFSTEGPQPFLIYRGNAILDVNGQTWVELPDYFEAINRDFHYQLTPIGGSAPDLHVAQEVSNNRFQISGGNPGLKVSWTVTGVRNDPFVSKYPVPDVQEKPAEQRGKYLNPEFYGKSLKMGVFHPASDEEEIQTERKSIIEKPQHSDKALGKVREMIPAEPEKNHKEPE